MKKKSKVSFKKTVNKAIKARLRDERLKDDHYKHTRTKVLPDKTKYKRKGKNPPDIDIE